MALSFANPQYLYKGPVSLLYVEVTFDSSYADGGETLTASTDLGLSQILMVIPTTSAGYNIDYTRTNDTSGKLNVYASNNPSTNSAVATPLEASVGRNLSSVTARLLVIGR